MTSLSRIKIEPSKARMHRQSVKFPLFGDGTKGIRDLAFDMVTQGQLVRCPAKLTKTGAVLYAGARRLAAARLIVRGFHYLPPDDSGPGKGFPRYIRKPNFRLAVEGVPDLWLSHNIREFSPMDRAYIASHMQNAGKKPGEIASLFSIDPGYVPYLARLVDLPREVQGWVHDKRMSVRAAMKLSEIPPDNLERLIAEHRQYLASGGDTKVTMDRVRRAIRDGRFPPLALSGLYQR